MRKPTTHQRSGSPCKRPRTEDELQEASAHFGRDWTQNDPVMPWIREHEPELRALVSSGWTWDDVGRAMALAGITYKTNAPMTGPVLRVKTYQARQARIALTAQAQKPASVLYNTQSVAMKEPGSGGDRPPTPNPLPARQPGEPEFRPVSLRQPYSPPQQPEKTSPPPAPKAVRLSEEEAMTLLTGRQTTGG